MNSQMKTYIGKMWKGQSPARVSVPMELGCATSSYMNM